VDVKKTHRVMKERLFIKFFKSDRFAYKWYRSRVAFKVATIAYKVHHGLAPNYIVDLCPPSGYLHQHNLRSVTRQDFATIRSHTSRIGHRTFTHSAAVVWNNLPTDLRESPSVSTFCRHLKTVLFWEAYSAQ
jgi:hypothetical protein